MRIGWPEEMLSPVGQFFIFTGFGWFLLARRWIHGFKENTAGGGLRFLTLACITLTCLATSLTLPRVASAAETDATCTSEWTNFTPSTFKRGGRDWTISNGNYAQSASLKATGPDGLTWSVHIAAYDTFWQPRSQCKTADGGTLIYNQYGGTTSLPTNSGVGLVKIDANGDIYAFGGPMYIDAVTGNIAERRNPTIKFGNTTTTGVYAKFRDNRERELVMDANGGAYENGSTSKTQIIDTSYQYVTDDKPTRAGYQLAGWNTKADGSGLDVALKGSTLSNGMTVYAQWTKDPGKPVKATISCAARQGEDGALCAIIAYYTDAPEQTRELITSGTTSLAWGSVSPIDGVELNQSGYEGNVSCIIQSAGGRSQCYYVSVAEKPSNDVAYQAQMPTTGAPEGLSLAGVVAVGVGWSGALLVICRRRD